MPLSPFFLFDEPCNCCQATESLQTLNPRLPKTFPKNLKTPDPISPKHETRNCFGVSGFGACRALNPENSNPALQEEAQNPLQPFCKNPFASAPLQTFRPPPLSKATSSNRPPQDGEDLGGHRPQEELARYSPGDSGSLGRSSGFRATETCSLQSKEKNPYTVRANSPYSRCSSWSRLYARR